jgi:hypothetical protein
MALLETTMSKPEPVSSMALPAQTLVGRLLAQFARPGPLDLRSRIDEHEVRFTNTLDEDAEQFERELMAQPIVPCNDHVGEGGLLTSEAGYVEPQLQQRIAWLRHTSSEVRLLQVRTPDGRPSMQAAIVVERPRWAPWLARAVVPRLGHAVNGAEEVFGLRLLRTLCTSSGDVVTLRLQARRIGVHALCDFEEHARRAGFSIADPEAVTRTLLLDLCASSSDLLAALPPKTRRKVRARTASPFEIREVTDDRYLASLQVAALASIHRTGGAMSRAPWGPLLGLAHEDPTRARILALFRRGGEEPLAFVAGVRHGALAEYVSAGSVDDAELRSHPFNYFLLWELAEWARANGATRLDLGGVTDGGPGDPLAGISTFKRHFTNTEAEIGREMIATLRPGARIMLATMRRLRDVEMPHTSARSARSSQTARAPGDEAAFYPTTD